jgi:hypothetical protein
VAPHPRRHTQTASTQALTSGYAAQIVSGSAQEFDGLAEKAAFSEKDHWLA